MKKTIAMVFLIFLMNSALAQGANITLTKKGYGENPREVYFTLHNTGDTIITDVEISVDGKEFKTIRGKSSPAKGFEFLLYLEPGEHLVEVRAPEGAYDSETVMVSSVENKEYNPQGQVISFTKTNTFKAVAAFVVISVVVVWLLVKRPRLDLSS